MQRTSRSDHPPRTQTRTRPPDRPTHQTNTQDGAAPGEAIPEFSWKEHSQILTTAAEGYGGNATPASTVAGGVAGAKPGGGGLGAATASIREKVMGALLS